MQKIKFKIKINKRSKYKIFFHKILVFVFRKNRKNKKKKANQKAIEFKAKNLTEFFENYELKSSKSLGKKYYRKEKCLKFFNFSLKAIKKSWPFIYKFSYKTVIVLVILALIYSVSPGVLSAPQSTTVTTRAQWESGELANINTTSVADAIQIEAQGSWTARTWAPTPDNISFGSTSTLVDNYLYVVRGYGDKAFYRYDATKNEWDSLEDLPQPAHYGCDASYDNNGNIYFIFGGYSKDFYKYNIEEDSWTQLPDLLDTIYYGTGIEFDGTDFYITRGQNSTDFWKFNVSENSWYNLAPTPSTIYRGSSIVYGQDGYMYVNRGYNQNAFYRYNITENSWDTMAVAPSTFYGEQKGVYYDGGIYFLRSNNTNSFYRYNIGSNDWTTLENSPQNNNYSSLTYNSEDGYIYAIRASGQYHLWKFDPEAGTSGEWIGPKDMPATVGTGGDLIWNGIEGTGNYVYSIRGNSNSFYRYDVTNNNWDTMASTPANLSYDTKGTYYDGNIYIPRGENGPTFYRYNVAGNSWSTLAAAPNNLRYGSTAVYNDGYIYVNRGNGTDDFYRYDISGDTWDIIDDVIVNDGTSYRSYTGARLESDGTDLYFMPGDGETAFLKYDVSESSWEELTSTSFAQYYGTDMTYFNGKIYALAGYYKDETWEYDISADSWRQLPSNQEYTFGRGPYNGASLEYAGNNSFYATPGFGLLNVWSYSLGANNYESSGTYISESIDLSYAASWVSFTTNEDIPNNTAIAYQTRTSSDEENWSSWESVSGTDIQSPANRYVQVKSILSTSDGVSTPTVYDFTIAYNSEDNDPTNPSSLTASSQEIGGETLVSETTYKHAHPYFSWSGASDNESGLAGYYVYFGTSSSADPETGGIYQEDSTFSVNLEMHTGNYYLRIKAKDNDGNISDDAWEAFIYNYSGVSPHLSEEKTTQADFEGGTNENISTSNEPDALQLEAVDGFWNESRLSYAPAGVRYGAELTYVEDEDKLYTFRGNNTTTFYAYDLTNDTWETLANAPATVYYGGYLIAGPEGYLYGARGYNTSTFWRYSIEDDEWTIMASAPKNFYYGSSLSYDGDRYVYALPGNEDAFYRYDTQNNNWTSLTNAEFGNPNEGDGQRTRVGSDSVFDGDNNIYALQGNYYPYFAKYAIDDDQEAGEIADSWTSLAEAPAGIYSGGSLTYDEETSAIYMLSGNYRQNFFKYDVGSNEWSQLPQIPAYVEYGASLEVVDGYIYAARGANSTSFFRFNIDENSWENPQQGFFGPTTTSGSSYFGFYYGGELAEDDSDNIYMIRGYRDNTFGRFNTGTSEFTELAKIPVGIYNGAAMIYNEDEDAIYLTSGDLRTRRSGSVNNYFMKYSVASNTWETTTIDRVPYQTSYGSSMTYDGSRYIYLTRGANSSTWWRYDTQASAGSRWSSNLPTISGWTQGYGGRIIYKDGYIYSTRGQNTNTFWRYDVSDESWTQMTNVPGNTYIGGSLADGGDGYLYATRGYNSDDYYRYNISGNSWETITDVPGQIYRGGASVFSGNRIWTTAGDGTSSYRDGLYDYVIGSTNNDTGFEKAGTYTSDSIDLLSVYRWANLSMTYTKSNNTDLTIYSRTSEDEEEWSAWDEVSNEKILGSDQYRYDIVSGVNRYIQIKIEFTSSDQIFSPLVSDYSVNYYQDIKAPTNPSSVNAYSASDKVTGITSTTWYNHVNPYFEWPVAEAEGGASDDTDGSGVAGYWVYFGTNSSADPYVDGDYQTGTSYQASNLISGENYYLRIKAIDNADMVPAETYQAFNYQFDSAAPTNPSDISVTPAGFTASDSYEFLWESDVADANSGLSKFQYRTGGDVEDTWYDIDDVEQVTLTIPNDNHIEGAYQSGKNWFYLRVIDNAGNISEEISQEYYYSADAPSPPQNLSVNPETSIDNSFSFEWEQPESFVGDASKLKYYYSINALPNAYNTVETTVKAAGPGPFATQKGSNRFYIVAKDEAENINYDLYAYIDFSANTTAPGAPVNAQIFDTSDRENQEYSVAIKWSPPTSASEDNFSGYVIYRSLEENGIYEEVATTSGTAYVDTGLESKMYYYYLKARDNTNNHSIPSSKVNIIPTGRYTTAPTITQESKVTVKSFAANFTWGTNRVASSFIEYGKTISLGETNGQVDSVTDHTVGLTGLSAATKYYYKVKFIDPDGNIGTSEVSNFTTLNPPVVSEFAVADIKLESALVSWKTNASATCNLKYGPGSYSGIIEEISSASSHIERLESLLAETSYQAQVDCLDSDGNEFSSDQYTFSTPVRPVASEIKVENKADVDLPTVVVEYKTNVATSTLVYFKHEEEGSNHTYLTDEKVIEHRAEIEGLDPAKKYALGVSGVDENGIVVETVEQEITTRSDSRPPEILVNRAVGKVVGRGNDAQANIYVKIETNELSKVKIDYAKGIFTSGDFEQSTGEDPFNTYHLITLPAEISQVYSYRAQVFDESGNLTTTKTATVIVEGAKKNATEVVADTVGSRFGWLSTLW